MGCHKFPTDLYPNYKDFLHSFPVLTFIFDQNKKVFFYPEDYLYQYENSDLYCPGIISLKDLILGAIFMQNYDITFDKINKKLAITRANCSQSQDLIPYISNTDLEGKIIEISENQIKENVQEIDTKINNQLKLNETKHNTKTKTEALKETDAYDSIHFFGFMFVLVVVLIMIYLLKKKLKKNDAQRTSLEIEVNHAKEAEIIRNSEEDREAGSNKQKISCEEMNNKENSKVFLRKGKTKKVITHQPIWNQD